MATMRKTQAILWVGFAAAAAGIGAVVAVVRLKERSLQQDRATHQLQDVQSLLTDCYTRINEIEHQLPQLDLIAPPVANGRSARVRSNGKPALD